MDRGGGRGPAARLTVAGPGRRSPPAGAWDVRGSDQDRWGDWPGAVGRGTLCEAWTGHDRGSTAARPGWSARRAGVGSEREVGMATRTVVCPECGAEVPYGRLSCVACGTLLASVAGASRRPVVQRTGQGSDGDEAMTPGDAVDAAAASAASARGARDATVAAASDDADQPPVPPVLHDWTGPVPPTAVDWTGPAPGALGAAAHAAAGPPAAAAMDRPDLPAPATGPGPVLPHAERPRDLDAEPLAATVAGAAEPDDEAAWPPRPAVAGAYVAPAIVPTAATTVDGRPATASSIAAASIAEGTVTSVAATPRPERWFSTPGQSQPIAPMSRRARPASSPTCRSGRPRMPRAGRSRSAACSPRWRSSCRGPRTASSAPRATTRTPAGGAWPTRPTSCPGPSRSCSWS